MAQLGERTIIKETRSALILSDENGKISKYRLETPLKLKMVKTVKTVKPKPKSKRVVMPNIDDIASKMPRCRVVLERYTQNQIDAIIRKSERSEMIRQIKAKLMSLPGLF